MQTTALTIEILVGGFIGQIWILLFIFRLYNPQVTQYIQYFEKIKDFATIITFNYISMIYILGWIIHFLTEATLDPLQIKFRDKLFIDNGVSFYSSLNVIFQRGSEYSLKNLEYDRQVLRILKSCILNFLLISISIIFYVSIYKKIAIIVFLLMFMNSVFLFFQWRSKYQATYKKIIQMYREIVNTKKDSSGLLDRKQ